MNISFFKSSSALDPCPPQTGLGTMNMSGILYLICHEDFYEPSNLLPEAPLSAPVIIAGYSLTIFLAVIIICGVVISKGRHIGYTRHRESVV